MQFQREWEREDLFRGEVKSLASGKVNTKVNTDLDLNTNINTNINSANLFLALLFETSNLLFTQYANLQSSQEEMLKLVSTSTSEIIAITNLEAERVIKSQREELESLITKTEEQTKMLCFLREEESKRKEAALQLLERKERKKRQKKKAVRDAATLPEFKEAIKIINEKKYKCDFVRSREKISLLVLFLTGIRVANLIEITASNLQCLLNYKTPVYFELNLIKSRKRSVHRTLLTKLSLQIVEEYREDILVLLKNKEPSEYVFTRKNSNIPLERAALTKKLNSILRTAGKAFGKNISSHSFRIGQVTILLEEFGLMEAQKVIGHENVETTLRYARNKLGTSNFESKMLKVDKRKYDKIARHKIHNKKDI